MQEGTSDAASGPDVAGPAVLFVDDEEDILFALGWFVRHHFPQVRVFTALSAQEGLDVVAREHLSLIVSDYRMPGMDGLEFLIRARALAPGVPRILSTAYPDPKIQERAYKEAGVLRFFPKAFEMEPLIDSIRQVLERVQPRPWPQILAPAPRAIHPAAGGAPAVP